MIAALVALVLLQDPSAGITSLAMSADGVQATAGHGGVKLGDTALGDPRPVFSIAFSRDGKFIAAGGGSAAEFGEVRVWNVADRKQVWYAREHRDLVMSVAWSADGKSLFAASADKTVTRHDMTGKVTSTLLGHAGPVLCLAVSPDGKTLVSGSADRSLRVWNTETNAFIRAFSSHSDSVLAGAWSPDGKYLASGSTDRTVRVFQPLIGRLVRIVRGHDGEIHALAYSADGTKICTGASDRKIRIIESDSDKVLQTIEAHEDWVTSIVSTKEGFVSADWKGKTRSHQH